MKVEINVIVLYCIVLYCIVLYCIRSNGGPGYLIVTGKRINIQEGLMMSK